MNLKASALGLALLVFPAMAMGQTTTDCRQTTTGMTCRSVQAGQIDWGLLNRGSDGGMSVIDAARAGREARMERERHQQAMADRDAARQAQEYAAYIGQQEQIWRDTLGKAMVEGRCGDARNMALGAGRLEVVDQVDRLCVPAKP